MAYVHHSSHRCDKSEIALFKAPSTQLSLEKGHWIDVHPVSNIDDTGPITFQCTGTDEYVDLTKMILEVKLKITNADGTNLADNQSDVSPVNNFLHSLFKQVDVYLNEKQVTPAMGTYSYRAYLETLLNYDVTAKESQLTSALYYKDEAGKMDVAGNAGFAKRRSFIQSGKMLVVTGPLFCDVFMCERLLLDLVNIKVILNRNPDEFCLLDTGGTKKNAKVKLIDATLKVRKVKVSDAVKQAHTIGLKQLAALYPVQRVECKSLIIPGNIPSIRKDDIFAGAIPTSFVFGLVDADAFSGTYGKNPYNFKHFNVTSVKLTVNGEELPFNQMMLNYGANKEDFVQAYNTLFSGTGKMNYNTGLDISREDYPKGYTLYAFDLTPDMCSSANYFNLVQRGSLAVEITFAAGSVPTSAVAMICYGTFEKVIQIDSSRNVVYDLSTVTV